MRVETAEDELEEWRTDGKEQNKVVGTLKKQLISLEKMCIKLQGMDLCVDTRDESIRSVSVSDEASAQALKTLKERIRSLEEEKRDLSKDAGNAREELAVLRERLKNGEDDNSDIVGLIDERNELREQIAALEEVDGLQRQEIEELQRKLRETVNGTCF
jgi:predicted  nucleic acid-binding Zn-ribbon protein